MTRKKHSKITVLLDADEFERFDRYCDSQAFKKSTLIARLIREHLDGAQFQSRNASPVSMRSGADQ